MNYDLWKWFSKKGSHLYLLKSNQNFKFFGFHPTGLFGHSHLRMMAFLLTWKYRRFFPRSRNEWSRRFWREGHHPQDPSSNIMHGFRFWNLASRRLLIKVHKLKTLENVNLQRSRLNCIYSHSSFINSSSMNKSGYWNSSCVLISLKLPWSCSRAQKKTLSTS